MPVRAPPPSSVPSTTPWDGTRRPPPPPYEGPLSGCPSGAHVPARGPESPRYARPPTAHSAAPARSAPVGRCQTSPAPSSSATSAGGSACPRPSPSAIGGASPTHARLPPALHAAVSSPPAASAYSRQPARLPHRRATGFPEPAESYAGCPIHDAASARHGWDPSPQAQSPSASR